jgi:hypothetical protein
MSTKIISYKSSINLGDAIQTVAMIEHLKKNNITNYSFVDRSNLENNMIINGWHRDKKEPLPKKSTYISTHTDLDHLKEIDKNNIIGCRDFWTLNNCKYLNLKSLITGCVTINLPKINYEQKTFKTLFIDSTYQNNIDILFKNDIYITQKIKENTEWLDQLNQASERLKLISSASLVHTTRLHILIPCIAMEIPVILDKIPKSQPERFTFFLDYIPINKVITKDSGIKQELLDIWEKNSSKVIEKS